MTQAIEYPIALTEQHQGWLPRNAKRVASGAVVSAALDLVLKSMQKCEKL